MENEGMRTGQRRKPYTDAKLNIFVVECFSTSELSSQSFSQTKYIPSQLWQQAILRQHCRF